MFENVATLLAQYRGMLQDAVEHCDETTQEFLTPAIDIALEGIENICPLVGVENPDGGPPILHWGPEGVADAKLVILAATPEKVMVMRAEEWIEPLDLPANVPPATLWAIIGRGVAGGQRSQCRGGAGEPSGRGRDVGHGAGLDGSGPRRWPDADAGYDGVGGRGRVRGRLHDGLPAC